MCKSLQTPDSQMISEEQSENFEIFEVDQRRYNYHPLVFSIDIRSPNKEAYDPLSLEQYFKRREECSKRQSERSKSNNRLRSEKNPSKTDDKNQMLLSNLDELIENPLLKTRMDIRLKSTTNPDLKEAFKNFFGINYLKPP